MSICVRLMLQGSPGSSSAATPPLSTTLKGSNRPVSMALSAPTSSTASCSAGGCDFVTRRLGDGARQLLWTPASLPNVIAITRPPAALADPILKDDGWSLDPAIAQEGPERLIERRGSLFRLHILEAPVEQTPCAVLPLDRLFAIRASAALRLWRGLTGRSPGRDPAALPATRRDRFARALRALDGRLDKASYRDIAEALFGTGRLPEHGWKTHDLRDRTIRLARLGHGMMQGGYRRLLLYPFRGRT